MGAFGRAVLLLVSGNAEVWFIAGTSLRFSLASTALACAGAIPLGVLIAVKRFAGRRALLAVMSSLMALPTVVIGLIVYSILSRSGPLGGLGLLFTPGAVIIGQAILAFPIALSMTASALSSLNPLLPEVLTTLGASRSGILWMTVREARGVVRKLSPTDLTRRCTIQGFHTTGLEAVSHVYEHFSHHAGQIIYITKMLHGKDLRFTKLPARKKK